MFSFDGLIFETKIVNKKLKNKISMNSGAILYWQPANQLPTMLTNCQCEHPWRKFNSNNNINTIALVIHTKHAESNQFH